MKIILITFLLFISCEEPTEETKKPTSEQRTGTELILKGSSDIIINLFVINGDTLRKNQVVHELILNYSDTVKSLSIYAESKNGKMLQLTGYNFLWQERYIDLKGIGILKVDTVLFN